MECSDEKKKWTARGESGKTDVADKRRREEGEARRGGVGGVLRKDQMDLEGKSDF